jgi:hypothetical protein
MLTMSFWYLRVNQPAGVVVLMSLSELGLVSVSVRVLVSLTMLVSANLT